MSKNQNDRIIKFLTSRQLKNALQQFAEARGISLSALIRLILSEYIKRKG